MLPLHAMTPRESNVLDRGGRPTEEHRNEPLRKRLARDQATLDHGLHDEHADNGQERHFREGGCEHGHDGQA